jgi:iron complex transport system ATP-binding protein
MSPTPSPPRLEASDLVVERGRRSILHGVSLSLGEGEALALVGPNAAGKSTLVRALAGLLPVRGGEVRVEGRPLADWPREALARAVALVTSDDEGAAPLTVRERVSLGRFPHRGPFRSFTADDEAAVDRALAQTDIAALAHRTLSTLSAGERQLATLARGLAQEPRVLLLDEPAAHLDVGHQLRLFRVLDDVRRCGVSVLAVVHDLPRAAAWAERMVLMGHGRVLFEGAPHAVLASAACAEAFGILVGVHHVAQAPHPLYSFREPR